MCYSFMVGNTYPYSLEDWKEDIILASTHHIDGFALNVGPEEWQKRSISLCYAAALALGSPFKLFLSFDMTLIPGNTPEDVRLLREHVAMTAGHPHQLWYRGGVFVSTFAGQDQLFGFPDLEDAWAHVKDALGEIAPIHLVPSFFIDPRRYPRISAMDGYFNWNGSWPIHLTIDAPRKEVENAKLDTDCHHVHHLGARTFMAAVSPWFFTHYGPNSWTKNWIYRGDDWLLMRRWEQLVANRSQIDIVQIISYNDFGESHYLGPIKGAQPNSQAWVDGYPHTAWLELSGYFARAFKEGAYPPVERDRIFMWSRPHLKDAEATEDEVPRPDRWQLTDDKFWVVVLATGPAEVLLATSDDAPAERWVVKNGVSKLSHPMVAGASMKATMVRDGIVVAGCTPRRDGFRVEKSPKTYNFNVYVAASP
ncbi:glycoside hydrolase family 71 protein [Dichomitus squalens]|nr:glycoside hydrolase family 71 protein [Dichomitus squalens]